MRLTETDIPDKNLFIDECETTPSSESLKINENTKLKRASWSPASYQDNGLPPTGKRIDHEHSTNSNRVRMRSKSTRNYQLQQPNQISFVRPVSYNESISNQLSVKYCSS